MMEKKKDSKPCQVCDGVKMIYRYKVSSEMEDGRLGDLLMDEPANFCPACGRDVTRPTLKCPRCGTTMWPNRNVKVAMGSTAYLDCGTYEIEEEAVCIICGAETTVKYTKTTMPGEKL